MLQQGDIIIVNFNPTVGHEPAKMRPAVVITDFSFNVRSSLVGVLPITSTNTGYPLHVPISCDGIEGFACIEQARNIDLAQRGYKMAGIASGATMTTIMGLVKGMYGLH